MDAKFLKAEFVQFAKTNGVDLNNTFALPIITGFLDYFKASSQVSKFSDNAFYVSGVRVWDEDPESTEGEEAILECTRQIYLNEDATEFVCLSVCICYPREAIETIDKFQSEWCDDKTKTDVLLNEIKTDKNFISLKDTKPRSVSVLSYSVKV